MESQGHEIEENLAATNSTKKTQKSVVHGENEMKDEEEVSEEGVKNVVEVKEIFVVPTRVYLKNILLFTLHAQTLIRNPRIILPMGNTRIYHIHPHQTIPEVLFSPENLPSH